MITRILLFMKKM